MREVPDVSKLNPYSTVGLLPSWEEIPEEFKNRHNKWNKLANHLFFNGGAVLVKEELDRHAVMQVLGACLQSFEPSHEHKEAGVAFLLSEWCNYLEPKRENSDAN